MTIPAKINRRDYHSEPPPPNSGIEVFNVDAASAINKARMEHIASLGLDLRGKRVLDAGCGVGHFSRLYRAHGSKVVGIDGRAANIAAMKQIYPNVEGHVLDVQTDPLLPLGHFDFVNCCGLLYHLDSPVAALRNIFSVCTGALFLETIICDSEEPLCLLADEPKTANQALAGLACRPSPAFIILALNRVGFDYVYSPRTPPNHPDFHFDWRNDRSWQRNGTNMRCTFVASRQPLKLDTLFDALK